MLLIRVPYFSILSKSTFMSQGLWLHRLESFTPPI